MQTEFRNLGDFTRWFLSQSFGSLQIPLIPVLTLDLSNVDGTGSTVTGLVLYRKAPYQVELFAAHRRDGGSHFPEHRHPDVDSVEYFLSGGNVDFIVNGKTVMEHVEHKSQDEKDQLLAGGKILVRARDWHGAKVDANGGAFLSIQRWKHGVEPTSVTLNWIGPPHLSHSAAASPPPE